MKEVARSGLTLDQLQSISQEILQQAARLGAHEAEVAITANKGFSVNARQGDVETVEYNQDKAIEITVFFGKRSGSSSLSDIRSEAVRAAVEAACHIAKFTDEDPAAGLADKEELALQYPQLDLAHPWSLTVEQAIELACQCEREAVAYDKRIMSAEEVTVATVDAFNLYANSLGFTGYFPLSRHDISCVLVAKEGDEMQRDFSYTLAVDPAQLESVSQVARHAAERTINRLGARRLRTTKAPIVFLAEEARGLLGSFTAAIQGGNIYRKSSFLLDQLDKQIFPSFISIQEQPHLPRALGSAPFDDDGVITRPNVFIENGILRTYALGTYAARKLGMKTTGNAGGVHNLTIQPGGLDLPALLKKMGTGLLITELMGQGVNLVTGDYSRGASGFWVENGEIQYPVHEITVAGRLQDMYAHIVEVGNDVDVRGNIRTGSILIEEMMIAGS
ncbi:metalloprotease PmbA [Aquicella lusitana]|uniref:Microcin-processing peptidase 1 n=1 Tax=Aquicella lusitana TaxID=254246 RepID=A0A370GZN9_9COXI|nr:metalloprotease PmbA [Aquicella lusitana]RDI48777.1 microcin-processing peptidase 1 [Aquicella lusitana]VVC73205.1 Metalloprotease PmbA [Aquicella lusitana]